MNERKAENSVAMNFAQKRKTFNLFKVDLLIEWNDGMGERFLHVQFVQWTKHIWRSLCQLRILLSLLSKESTYTRFACFHKSIWMLSCVAPFHKIVSFLDEHWSDLKGFWRMKNYFQMKSRGKWKQINQTWLIVIIEALFEFGLRKDEICNDH